jgi:UTP--glucose-1-phosphate uridylyltransferase
MGNAQVRKAVITAAGRGTRQYPATNAVQKELLPIVDVDGITRPALQIIVAEALAAGIQQICIVVSPGSTEQLRRHFRPLDEDELRFFQGKDWALRESERLAYMASVITYVQQEKQEGYGHAVFCARDWVGDEPFLLMLGDHLYLSDTDEPCAAQVVQAFQRYGATLSAVASVPASELHLVGTARGCPIEPGLYKVERLVEKPSPQIAEQELKTPGLPEGHYLGFFGMHIFTPGIFEALDYLIRNNIRERGEIQLTSAQELLRQREPYLALVVRGSRHDTGTPDGYVETIMAFANARRRRASSLGK